MTSHAVRSDLHRFFERLSPPPGQFLEVRTIVPDGSAEQIFVSSPRDAIRFVTGRRGHANIYVGACPRFERRGTRESINTVVAAWADLDFKDFDASNRGRAKDLLRERLESFRLRPTMVVFTGNGEQAWWLFHRPVTISSEFPAERFEAINRGIARTLGGDAVHDLARILRVPGTMNLPDAKKRASGCVPRMARLIHDDGPTDEPGDFARWEIHERPAERRAKLQPISPSMHADAEVLDAFNELLRRLGPDHPLTRTWRGDRSLRDTSRSGWDMALTNQLVRAHVRREYIPHILRAYARGRGVFATDDYIQRTLTKGEVLQGSKHGSTTTA